MRLNLDKEKKYLLACSYGPDSMALLGLLQEGGYDFEVAHVNYHFRGKESDEETANLIRYAEERGYTFHIHDTYYEKHYGNFEAWARHERYQFFKDIISKNNLLTAVLIGHHQDDLIETYLLQKKRKNRPYWFGLQEEIEIQNIIVLRPLLDKTRIELREYCLEKEIPFADDSSNRDLSYSRNKIRHELVEHLTGDERRDLLKEIQNRNFLLEQMRLKLLKKFSLKKPLPLLDLLTLSEKEFAYLLFMYLSRRGIHHPLSQGALREVRKVLLSPKPNIEWKINSDFKFAKAYQKLYLLPNEQLEKYEIILEKPGKFKNEWLEIDFRSQKTHRGIKKEDYPLTIRSYEDDDEYEINGYLTSVRRLFIDWKIPQHLRAMWPVFVNQKGEIIYIPRYREDFELVEDSDLIIRLPFIC
ncbi:MAG: tRNA lysidine(34) synthetase TilS [Bacilli bacterium]|jgi:bifunctional protein TilS/HprT